MATLQTVIDLARFPLNDSDPEDENRRYRDATILQFVISGLMHAFRQRPDLFVGQFMAPPTFEMPATSNFPLPDQYVQVLADYATARCETVDDEHVISQRAAMFMQLFGGEVPS